jgi:glycosyltransferase involved in cell wall biosynthesis
MNSKGQPFVSIVTPVWNGEAHIGECIESILAQTHQNWEYIILNNNSDDRTLEIAEAYRKRDSRIRVYSNTTFLSIIANHNKAFSLISAESRYCKVVSADDWILPECIERMVNLAEKNPSVGIVGAYQLSGGEGIWYLRNTGLPYSPSVVPGREVCRAHLLGALRVFGNPTSVMYRADLMRGADPFFPNDTMEADTSACLKHLRFSDFGFVHQVLAYERIHKVRASTTALDINSYTSAEIADCQTYGEWYLSRQECDARIAELLDAYYAYMAKCAFKRKGKQFWIYHIGRLHDLGLRLDVMRFAVGIASQLLDLTLHPRETIQMALTRMRIRRAHRGASLQ